MATKLADIYMPEWINTLVATENERYEDVRVKPIRPPTTPDWNINNLTERFHTLSIPEGRAEIGKVLGGLSILQLRALQSKWSFWARTNQLAPSGDWTFWLLLAGRGFGKTRTGAEWINERVESGVGKRIALVAPTAADVRKTMVEGESGILAISPPWNYPVFEPSKLQLTWPNGAIAQLFSAEEPERLRGPQCDTFWADELAAWKNMQMTWDMLQFGFRLGDDPRGCITTTPKPVPIVKTLITDSKPRRGAPNPLVALTRGSTYDNKGNLAKKFYQSVVTKYEGTRLGRQELDAEVLEDMPGALWKRSDIERRRIQTNCPQVVTIYQPDELAGIVQHERQIQDLMFLRRLAAAIVNHIPEDVTRIVVAIDPNASNNEGSDETGIIVAARGVSGHGYVLADLSMRGTPNEWANSAVIACDVFNGDRIVAEANNGGNMVENTVVMAAKALRLAQFRKSDFIPVQLVHASHGKVTRAEPVAALYEQGRVSHIGTHKVLEDQMCLFTSDFDRKAMGYSPDRVDALVWVLTQLFLEGGDSGLLDFMKSEVEAMQQRSKPNNNPKDWTRMVGPATITQAYGIGGDMYTVTGGVVFVRPTDVKGLRSAGFEVSDAN